MVCVCVILLLVQLLVYIKHYPHCRTNFFISYAVSVQRLFKQHICVMLPTTRPVVLKLVGSIEPNRCHASIDRTLDYNQERIQKILEGVCSFELG